MKKITKKKKTTVAKKKAAKRDSGTHEAVVGNSESSKGK